MPVLEIQLLPGVTHMSGGSEKESQIVLLHKLEMGQLSADGAQQPFTIR